MGIDTEEMFMTGMDALLDYADRQFNLDVKIIRWFASRSGGK
jgi:hypothetical protein